MGDSDNDLSSRKATSVIDIEHLPAVAQKEISALKDENVANYVGVGNKKRIHWDTPRYNASEAESVHQNGNAFVVLGRDRNTDVLSGFGGKGAYHCAAIDLVVGRGAAYGSSLDDENAHNIVDPDFKVDAARVYISQKADIDTYLELDPDMKSGKDRRGAGYTTEKSPRSTVAIKADVLRFVSRENIKIVTRTDKRNAQGGLTNNAWTGKYGIDLVAMNKFDELQPMVLGDNLAMCLTEIVESIQSLRTIVEDYIDYNNSFNRKVMFHQHPPAIPYNTIFPSIQDTMPEGVQFTINSAVNVEVPAMLQHPQECNNILSTYLEAKGGGRAEKYILSILNRNN